MAVPSIITASNAARRVHMVFFMFILLSVSPYGSYDVFTATSTPDA
jgi:hypothetical protein